MKRGQSSLKKFTLFHGVISLSSLCFCLAFLFNSSKNASPDNVLNGAIETNVFLDFNKTQTSCIIASVLWGVMLVKAAQGFSAATAKDIDELKLSIKRSGILIAVASVVAVIQYGNSGMMDHMTKTMTMSPPRQSKISN